MGTMAILSAIKIRCGKEAQRSGKLRLQCVGGWPHRQVYHWASDGKELTIKPMDSRASALHGAQFATLDHPDKDVTVFFHSSRKVDRRGQ